VGVGLLGFGADAVDDKAVADRFKSVLAADLIAHRLQPGTGDFDHATGFDADEMALRRSAEAQFIMSVLGINEHFGNDLGFLEVLERAVDGGLADAVASVTHLVEQLFGFKDAFLIEYGIENLRPLGGELEALPFEEAPEDRADGRNELLGVGWRAHNGILPEKAGAWRISDFVAGLLCCPVRPTGRMGAFNVAMRTIHVGMIGCGTVGSGVARLLREEAPLYEQRLGAAVRLSRVLVRDAGKDRPALGDATLLTDDADAFFATEKMDIVVEVAGSVKVLGLVRRAIEAGKHVVTANKSLLAAHGAELFALARQHGVSIAFEASCGGGIPIITAMKFGLMANRVQALYGILNGTCNYILTEMTQKGKDYATALREAQDAGYAEADPYMDVSGRDAAEKLAILASLAFGMRVSGDNVWSEGIEALEPTDFQFAAELGYRVKLLAIGEQRDDGQVATASLRVHPCFVHDTTPLAQVSGSFNALSVYGHAAGHTMYYGRGAGQMPTASAVVSDLLNVASGWYAKAFAEMNLWCDRHAPVRLVDADELVSRFYIRVNALDEPGVLATITSILGEAGISLASFLQHESAAGQFVSVVFTTHEARQGAVRSALAAIDKSDRIQGKPVWVRIVDLPGE